MAKKKTTTWYDQTQTQDSRAGSRQQLRVAGAGALEKLLQELAGSVYQGIVGDIGDLGQIGVSDIMSPRVSPEMQRLVLESQRASMGVARQQMEGLFEDVSGNIANDLAARGVLDSSAYGTKLALAQREMARQYGQMAQASQAQSAQQLVGLSESSAQRAMALRGMRAQMQQYAADPGLLRLQTETRLRTGTLVGNQWGSATNRQFGWQKSKEETSMSGWEKFMQVANAIGGAVGWAMPGGLPLKAAGAAAGAAGEAYEEDPYA